MQTLRSLLIKHKEIILYGVFGIGATLINIASFWIFDSLFGMRLVIANTLAWLCAFIFAFVTNKLFVFESKSWRGKTASREFLGFLIARIGTLILDDVLMWVLIDCFTCNAIVSKVLVNSIIIVTNYVASKMWVFRARV